MRRNWLSAFIFALALAFQAVAPVAANVAMEHGSGLFSDVCLRADGKAAGESQLPGPRDSQHDLCALCEVWCSGVAPLEARPNPVGLAPVQWAALAWTVADRAMPALRHDHARQARAPPHLS